MSLSSPTEALLRRITDGEVVVIDVRPAPEYAGGHLPGAVHIPVVELADRLAELPADREIIAYCRGPYRVLAHDAVRRFNRRGYRANRATNRGTGVANRRPARARRSRMIQSDTTKAMPPPDYSTAQLTTPGAGCTARC